MTKPSDTKTRIVDDKPPELSTITKSGTAPTAQASVKKPVAQTPRITRYTVRRGDTMYSIARQFKVAIEDLLRWNRLSSNALKPGTELTIRLAQNP